MVLTLLWMVVNENPDSLLLASNGLSFDRVLLVMFEGTMFAISRYEVLCVPILAVFGEVLIL